MICSSVNLLFFLSVLPLKTDSTNLRLVRPMGSRSSVANPRGPGNGAQTNGRGKLGSKQHIVVDASGIPLVIFVSGANRHYSNTFAKCVNAIPAIAGQPRRPRKRPAKLHADKGYDFKHW
jgi:hypothetical protein